VINFPSRGVKVPYGDAIDIRAFEKNDFATGGLRKGLANGWVIEDISEKFEVHIGHWQREPAMVAEEVVDRHHLIFERTEIRISRSVTEERSFIPKCTHYVRNESIKMREH